MPSPINSFWNPLTLTSPPESNSPALSFAENVIMVQTTITTLFDDSSIAHVAYNYLSKYISDSLMALKRRSVTNEDYREITRYWRK